MIARIVGTILVRRQARSTGQTPRERRAHSQERLAGNACCGSSVHCGRAFGSAHGSSGVSSGTGRPRYWPAIHPATRRFFRRVVWSRWCRLREHHRDYRITAGPTIIIATALRIAATAAAITTTVRAAIAAEIRALRGSVFGRRKVTATAGTEPTPLLRPPRPRYRRRRVQTSSFRAAGPSLPIAASSLPPRSTAPAITGSSRLEAGRWTILVGCSVGQNFAEPIRSNRVDVSSLCSGTSSTPGAPVLILPRV